MKVKKFDVTRMRQQQAFEFYNKVYLKIKFITYEPIYPYREALKTANEEFDIALKPIRKSEITERIMKEDENRDRAWRGIRAAIQMGLNHFKPEVVAAAKRVAIIFNTYGDPTKLPYTEETGTLRNLCTDIDKKLQFSDQTALGIVDWVKELVRANEEVAKQVNYREGRLVHLESGDSKAKRQAVDNAFKKLAEMINAYGLTDQEEASRAHGIAKEINYLIDQENAVMKARTTRRANKKGDEPEETGNDVIEDLDD